jgi:hypothetical protein
MPPTTGGAPYERMSQSSAASPASTGLHVIPLAYAWRVGAWTWSDPQREAFANDPIELRAVDGPTNNSKRDRGPSRWLPPNAGVHCEYAAAWSSIASAYALPLEQADTDTIARILAGC